MTRYVIEGRQEKDPLSEDQLYWNNTHGWVPLSQASVFLDTSGNLPIGECYWIKLPDNGGPENLVVVSKDPNSNWNDDLIQFARFIAELEASGNFQDMGYVHETLESMDLAPESMDELLERAQKYWDSIKKDT